MSFIGSKRALMASRGGGPGWDVAGVGTVRSLRALGAAVDANPSANVTMLGNYDARRDNVLSGSVITCDYAGVFDGANYAVRNLRIVNTQNDQLAIPVGIAFFYWNEGTVKNLDVYASIAQLGARNNNVAPEIMVYRVAAIIAYNHGIAQDLYANARLYINGNLGYNAGAIADNLEDGTATRVTADTIIQATKDAYNTYMAGCIAVCRGPATDCHTLSITAIAPSGTTDYVTLQDPTGAGPFPTSGSWIGGLIGQLGYYTGTTTISTVADCTVRNAYLVNSDNAGVANYTGGFAPIQLSNTTEDCTVYNVVIEGANSCGGFIGQQRNSPSPDPDASIIQRCRTAGTVTGSQSLVGGFIGSMTGTLSHFVAEVEVTGLDTCGNVGAAIGGLQSTAIVSHGIATLNAIGGTGVAGFFGWKHANATINQVLALGSASGNSIVGAVGGFDNGDANVTNAYSCLTTSGMSRLAGNVVSPTGMAFRSTAQLQAALPTGFDGSWTQGASFNGLPYLTDVTAPTFPTASPVEYLVIPHTEASPYTIPAPWVGRSVRAIVIGRGGNGASGSSTAAGGGGGGGAKVENVGIVLGSTEAIQIGSTGSAVATWFRTSSFLLADYGRDGTASAGAGGTAAASTGGTKVGGGNGGGTGSGARAGGGGGGAAGLNGAGKNAGSANGSASFGAGGGGGAADGGSVGVAGIAATGGGNGGASFNPDPSITAAFTATISTTTMTVMAVSDGGLIPLQVVTGSGVTAGTVVVAQLTGVAGSTGTYEISPSQTVASPTSMTAATPSGATAGGTGATSTASAGNAGSNGSGGGGGYGSVTQASAGGVGSYGDFGAAAGSGSGAGGGGGKDGTPTGGAGGAGAGFGGGGGGGGRGTTGGAGGAGAPGGIIIIYQP